jgi:hypothetical protein
VAPVGCISKITPPQSVNREISLKLKLDGGLLMDAKKWKINFKKFTIGVTIAMLTNASVLP